MKLYEINEKQIQEMLNYLASHRYADVYQLINMLTKLPEKITTEENKEIN
jgi:hypothetical protein